MTTSASLSNADMYPLSRWEQKFTEQMQEKRETELNVLWSTSLVTASSMLISKASPLLVSASFVHIQRSNFFSQLQLTGRVPGNYVPDSYSRQVQYSPAERQSSVRHPVADYLPP